MTTARRLWPLVADRMTAEALDGLDTTLTEWAGVPLYAATVDDLDAALRSLGAFHEAAVKVYAERLVDTGMAELEDHANGGRP